MKRLMITLALATAFTICFAASMMASVSAVSEFVGPETVVVKAGSASSATNMALFTGNDSQYMVYSSNKSGDKNYYESFKIESDGDIGKYFNTTNTNYYLPVEYKDEKLDGSYTSHKKVIRLQDRYSYTPNQTYYWSNQLLTQRYAVHNDSALNMPTGFFEFYFMSEAWNGTFMVSFGDHKFMMYRTNLLALQGKNYGISLGITPIGGKASQFFWQTNWSETLHPIDQGIVKYEANKWYHVKLAFNFNNSWAILINNVTAYNSTNWASINPALKVFNAVSMMTVIRTNASYHDSHVFYMDALGLSYNITGHNTKVPQMTFNADYVPYVDINSHNNLNDHVANSTFVAYFLFNFRELLNRSSSAVLRLKARYTALVTPGKGILWLYNQTTKTYDRFANYTPYLEYPAEEFTFSSKESGATIINRSTYVSDKGLFSIKIEAESSNNFEYWVDLMAVELVLGADMNQVLIIILVVIGVVAVFMVYRITQRSAPRARAGARKARRNLR